MGTPEKRLRAGEPVKERLQEGREKVMNVANAAHADLVDVLSFITTSLPDGTLELFEHRLAESQLPDGSPRSSSGARAAGVSDPTAVVGLVTFPDPKHEGPDGDGTGTSGWHPDSDPQADAVASMNERLVRMLPMLHDAARSLRAAKREAQRLSHESDFVVHIGERKRKKDKDLLYSCQVCDRIVAGTRVDPLRHGLVDSTCYKRFQRSDFTDLQSWVIHQQHLRRSGQTADDQVADLQAEGALPTPSNGG